MSKARNIVIEGGFDFHCHSTCSDGRYTVRELCDKAIELHFSKLSITDHNSVSADIEEISEEYKQYGLDLVIGSELTATYNSVKTSEEIHVVALGFKPHMLAHIFDKNTKNRRAYIEAILERLHRENVADIQYDELANNFKSHYLGKMHIAQMLTKLNVTSSVYEALDLYVGNLGKRRCWVPSSDYIEIPTLEEVVSSIISAGGIPVLAHPFYYKSFSNDELEKLVEYFKILAEDKAGIEVYYKDYNEKQTACLEFLANKYKINASGGSDFHGWSDTERLIQFKPELATRLLHMEG